MANHVRKQIRDAAVAALTGLATTGAHVFASRVYQLQDNELPALKIDTLDETSTISSMGVGRVYERTVTLEVTAAVKQLATYNDTIDQIAKEVEIALAANNTLGGACKYIGPPQMALTLDGAGETPRALAALKFDVAYYTAFNTPDIPA